MDLQFRGKTAVIIGGASNIGRAISLTLGKEGANIVIADIDPTQSKKVVSEIEQGGGTAVYFKTDITSVESAQAMCDKTIEQFGQIHVLVNSVGWDTPQLFVESNKPKWDQVIGLTLYSEIIGIRVVLPHMIEKGYGRIVNITSDAGKVGQARSAIYSGCKGGVIAMTKAIAREVGRYNVTLNCVSPGMTFPTSDEQIGSSSTWARDEMASFKDPVLLEKIAKEYVLRRFGTAQDAANAVAFLASDAANYITGQTLSVSGGFTMS